MAITLNEGDKNKEAELYNIQLHNAESEGDGTGSASDYNVADLLSKVNPVLRQI